MQVIPITLSILGAHQSGKTSVLSRFFERTFPEKYEPTNGSKRTNHLMQAGENLSLSMSVWDTSEEDLTTLFVVTANTNGAIITVDSTKILKDDLSDYENGIRKMNRIKQSRGNIPFLLLGTKTDLLTDEEKKQVNEKITSLAEQGCFTGGLLCSAKTGEGVAEAFTFVVRHLG